MNIGSRKGGLRVQPASMEEMKKARAEKTKMDGAWLESLTHSEISRAASFDHTWTLLAKAHQSGDHETLESAYAFVGQLAMRHMQLKDGIFKAKMKSVFNAKRGMCLAGGDMDQMHLRIIANMYRIPVLLDACENGLDPHNALAYAVFGDKFAKASGWGPDGFSLKRKPLGGDALQMREAMKTFRYAVIYGASPDTAWKVYVAVENDVGGLPFSGNWINEGGKRVWKPLEKNEIRTYHAKWREAEPEWKTNFWDPCAAAYQANAALKAAQGGSFGIHAGAVGFLTEGLLGTRSGALEGGSPSATSNWEVLRREAIYMRMVEDRLMQRYPYRCSSARERNVGGFWSRYGDPDPGLLWDEGLISNVHDWLCVQMVDGSGGAADIGATDWGKRQLLELKELMTLKIPGEAVVYSCEPGIGRGAHEV